MRQSNRMSHFMAIAALSNVEAIVNCTHRLPLLVSEKAPNHVCLSPPFDSMYLLKLHFNKTMSRE